MKTFLKRRLAILLTICMLCSMLPVPVRAADSEAVLTEGETVQSVTVEEPSAVSEPAPVEEPQNESEPASVSEEAEDSTEELASVSEEAEDSTVEPASVSEEAEDSAVEPISELASGTCGKKLTWSLSQDYVLTISGTGDMTVWTTSDDVPWKSYQSRIAKIVIEDGVTSISDFPFSSCTALTSVEIPETVTSIGASAFKCCFGLTNVVIPEGVTSIGSHAFAICNGLRSISIPSTVTSIGADAFTDCRALANVYYGGSKANWGEIDIQEGNERLTAATLQCAIVPPDIRHLRR